MLEPAVVVLRLMQYAGAMILMGSSLFFLYALPRSGPGSAAETPWARGLLAGAGVLLALATGLGLAAQSSMLAGSLVEGLKPETLLAVVSGMDLGKAAVVRAAVAGLATASVLTLRPGRTSWLVAGMLGVIAVASFPWMGHGAASEGQARLPHLVADLLHGWAAAVWIGALVAFFALLQARPRSPEAISALHRSLHGFSGLGTLLVAALVATGLVNSWLLVGPERIESLWTTAYGRLLALKLALFVVMLALASANRFRLTPALAKALDHASSQPAALAALRRSLVLETLAGVLVLALVAWFGTLAPPAAL